MALALLILIIALIVGGVGLFVEGLKVLLIVGLVLLLVSFFFGYRGRARV